MSRREDREAAKKKQERGKQGLVARFLGENGWAIAAGLYPVLMDGVHWLVFDKLNDRLRQLLLSPGETTIIAMLGLYLTYIVALGFVGRLKPEIKLKSVTLTSYDEKTRRTTSVKSTWPDILFFYPSFGFGIILIMGAVTVSGMAQDTSPVSEGWQKLAVFGAAGLFFAHLTVKFGGFEARHPATRPRYLFYLIPTVLVSEVMLNLSTALWYRFFGPEAGAPAPDNPDVLISFAFAVPLFLLFFAAPRFTFMSKSFTWPSLISGVALALYELWGMVVYAPLV
jgi:hypothetical protein